MERAQQRAAVNDEQFERLHEFAIQHALVHDPQVREVEGAEDLLRNATLPSNADRNLQVALIASIVENILDTIPPVITERAHYCSPPLQIPSKEELICSPDKIPQFLGAILKQVDWSRVYAEDRYSIQTLKETVASVVDLAARSFIGKSEAREEHDPDVLHRSLKQCGRIVALLTPSLRRSLNAIPVPEIPVELPKEVVNIEERAKHARKLSMAADASVRLVFGYVGAGLSWVGSAFAIAAVATGMAITKAAKAVGKVIAKVCRAPVRGAVKSAVFISAMYCETRDSAYLPQPIKNAWKALEHGLQAGALKIAELTGAAWYGTWRLIGNGLRTCAYGVGKGLSAVVQALKVGIEGIGTAFSLAFTGISKGFKACVNGLKAGLRAMQPWRWPVLRKFGAQIRSFLSKDSSWFDILNFRNMFSGVNLAPGEQFGKIDSRDQDFSKKLCIVQVLGVGSKNGKLYPVKTLLEAKLRNQPELLKRIFPTATFEQQFTDRHPDPGKTIMNVAISRGRKVANLPLPMGYQIKGIRFVDRRGNTIPNNEPIEVRSCLFGSAEVNAPRAAYRAQYMVEPIPVKFTINELKSIVNGLGVFPAFLGVEGEAFHEALDVLPMTVNERMQLLYSHQVERGFCFTADRFVHNLLRYAGGSITEMVGGLRMGTSDPLSLFLTVMFQQHGIPSVVVSGMVPDHNVLTLQNVHAQAGVLGEDNVHTFDLAAKSLERVRVRTENISVYQTAQVLGHLKKLTNEELFNLGGKLNKELLNDGKSNFFVDFTKNVRRTFKRVKQIFESSYGNVNFGGELANEGGQALQDSKLGRVAKVLALRIAIDKHIERGIEHGTVKDVLEFVSRVPKLPPVDAADSDVLKGTRYADTLSLRIRDRLHSFYKEALASPNFARKDKEELLRHAYHRLPSSFRVANLLSGGVVYTDQDKAFQRAESTLGDLTLEEALEVFTAENVAVYSSDFLVENTLYGIIGLSVGHEKEQNLDSFVKKQGKWLKEQSPALLETYFTRLLEIATVRAQHKESIRGDDQEKLVRLCSVMATAIIETQKNVLPSSPLYRALESGLQSLTKTISVVNRCGEDIGSEVILHDLLEGTDLVRRSWKTLVKRVGFPALLETMDRAYMRQTAITVERFLGDDRKPKTNTFFRRSSHSVTLGDGVRLDQALTLMKENGLDVSPHVDRLRLRRLCKQQLNAWDSWGSCINYPVPENPASYLTSELSKVPLSSKFRLMKVWVKHDFITEEEVIKFWPKTDEKKVSERLSSNLSYSHTASGVNLCISNDALRRTTVRLSELLPLARVHAKTDPRLHAILAYNSHTRPQHWATPAFEKIIRAFPKHWKSFLSTDDENFAQVFARGLLTDLYEGVSGKDAYRGTLWLAAHAARGDLYECCRNVRRAARGLDPLSTSKDIDQTAASVVFDAGFEPPDDISPVLVGLGARAQVAAALGGVLLTDIEFSNDEWRHLAFDERMEKPKLTNAPWRAAQQHMLELKVPARLTSCIERGVKYVEDPRIPMMEVWHKLFTQKPIEEVKFDSLASAATRSASLLLQRMKDPWPQFLFSRNGHIVVRSRAGDFRELNEYAPGDDLKQVDWRTSAKSDKLYVRLNQEDEQRDITMVFDVELLREGLATWMMHVKAQAAAPADKPHPVNPDDCRPKALMDLLVFLELAARDDRTVNFVLMGRGVIDSWKDVVKSRGIGGRSTYDAKRFLEKLGPALISANDLLEHESAKAIFGAEGAPSLNIFSGGELPFADANIFVFGLSKKNHDQSVQVYRSLERQGKLVAQMKRRKES